MNFFNFKLFFTFLFFLVNIHSSEIIKMKFFFRFKNLASSVKLNIILCSCLDKEILMFIFIFYSLVDGGININKIWRIFNVHLIFTVSFGMKWLLLWVWYKRVFHLIFMSIFMQNLIMQEVLFYVDKLIFFGKRR